MNVALLGSVSSSHAALTAMRQSEVQVTAVLGVDESQAAKISDYRSLRPLAAEGGIPFQSFVSVVEPQVESFLRAHAPDTLWVIGLSQLVPDRLLRIARFGGIGFHPTMLPRGRGRAPVAWTILLGEPAAVSLFHLTEEPDAGDLIAQQAVPVRPRDTARDLIARTNDVLSEVITGLAPRIISGALPRTPQDHGKATYYGKRTPADGLIHWSRSTERIDRLIRAAGDPYPGAFTFLRDRKVTIRRAEPADLDTGEHGSVSQGAPGTIVRAEGAHGALLRTGDGVLRISEVEGIDPAALSTGMRFGVRPPRFDTRSPHGGS